MITYFDVFYNIKSCVVTLFHKDNRISYSGTYSFHRLSHWKMERTVYNNVLNDSVDHNRRRNGHEVVFLNHV